MNFVVVSNIPIPPLNERKGSGRQPKYPFNTMNIGDSFAVNLDEVSRNTIDSAARAVKKKYPGKDFTVRKTSSKELRIWRIA